MGFKYTVEPSLENKFEEQMKLANKRVDNAKHLTADEFLKELSAADVLIPFPKMQYEPTLLGKLSTKINQFFTGTRFTSCKLVSKNGTKIIGYGAQAGTMNINSCEAKRFLNEHVDTILLRHNSITKDVADKVVDEMLKWEKVNPPYNYLATIKGWLAHILGEAHTKTRDTEFMDHAASALVCSSVVYRSFIAQGVQIEHRNDVRAEYIFPLDFLCSKSFTIVGGYFSADFEK